MILHAETTLIRSDAGAKATVGYPWLWIANNLNPNADTPRVGEWLFGHTGAEISCKTGRGTCPERSEPDSGEEDGLSPLRPR